MSKINFNDHLDDMMERLMNEDITAEQLELEIKRSKAICQVVEKKIESQKVLVDVMVALSSGDIEKDFIPAEFSNLKKIESK